MAWERGNSGDNEVYLWVDFKRHKMMLPLSEMEVIWKVQSCFLEGGNQEFSFGQVKLDIPVVMSNRHLYIWVELEGRYELDL